MENNLFDRLTSSAILYRRDALRVEVIALASLLLSGWIIASHPTINKDGILYLLTARSFLEQDFSQVMASYFWPFYSIVIALLHQLTAIPLHYAGSIITSLCFLLVSYAFVKIVEEMGGSRRAQLIALLIILFHPLIADYRASIVRDPGFLGFMLLSVLELIRYNKIPTFTSQLRWLAYVTLAFLSRPEMVIVALVTPMGLLLFGRGVVKERIKVAAKFLSLLVLVAVVVAFIMRLFDPVLVEKAKPVIDTANYFQAFSNLQQQMRKAAEVLSGELIKHTAVEDAPYAVYAALFTLLLVNCIRAFTPIYFLLLLFTFVKRVTLPIDTFSGRLILLCLATVFSYLIVFVLSWGFMLERYCFPLVVLGLLFLPFCVDKILTCFRQSAVVWLLFYLISAGYVLDTVVSSSYKKNHIIEAAQWIKNGEMANTPLITNRPNIAYFSQAYALRSRGVAKSNKEILASKWLPGHIYALHFKADDIDSARKTILLKNADILKEISNSKNDKVIIFQVY